MLRFFGFLFFLSIHSVSFAQSPSVLYLTWIHDPTTTMTIQWHTGKQETATEVLFRRVGGSAWEAKQGVFTKLAKTDYLVHTVELEGLSSDTMYEFSIQGKQGSYQFRTMPKALNRPIRYVVGGDAYYYYHHDRFRKMNALIAAQDPDFVVIGGDIAYAHGSGAIMKRKSWVSSRWRTFLQEWKQQMVTRDGRLIPMLPVVGNHDVRGSRDNPLVMFYDLFAFPNANIPFRNLDFGNYLSLFLLDTGHSYPIKGQQTEWLKQALGSHENASYKMAVYHVGAFPSVYPYKGTTPSAVRREWSPLFEKYHLNVAFEHHSHAYKRTYPIKEEKVDPNGVLYLGDGSWGVPPRKVKNAGMWYLAKAERVNAVCLVTLNPKTALLEALSIDGEVFDTTTTYPMPNGVAFNEARLLRY